MEAGRRLGTKPCGLQMVRGWAQEEEPTEKTGKGAQWLQANHSTSLHFSLFI